MTSRVKRTTETGGLFCYRMRIVDWPGTGSVSSKLLIRLLLAGCLLLQLAAPAFACQHVAGAGHRDEMLDAHS